ncbi:membrane protein insertase YidC [Cellulomonas sp. NS3]|uniref:membrane protein insertase YidC n=1 Tax=Cellulomonas sp. NS3 TaxID=2973977 RepID=UPI002163EBCA|nr:membrane protein insertase YidC [Cellulomonas sp. NS3]
MPVVDAVLSAFSTLVHPLQLLVAWLLAGFHHLGAAAGLDPAGGPAWALAIVGLVVVVRLALVPLVVVQVRALRGVQAIQPELRRLRDRYVGRTDAASRQALQREQAELMRTSGANPLLGCLPALVQAPVLFALFATVQGLSRHEPVGALTGALVRQADAATVLGAPLSGVLWGSGHGPTIAVTAAMIVLMGLTQLVTQRITATRNTSPASLEGNPLARQQQTVLLWVLPVLVAVPGLHVPVGVLLYWLTSTVWSLGQQLVVLRVLPNPGSAADRARTERLARRAARG